MGRRRRRTSRRAVSKNSPTPRTSTSTPTLRTSTSTPPPPFSSAPDIAPRIIQPFNHEQHQDLLDAKSKFFCEHLSPRFLVSGAIILTVEEGGQFAVLAIFAIVTCLFLTPYTSANEWSLAQTMTPENGKFVHFGDMDVRFSADSDSALLVVGAPATDVDGVEDAGMVFIYSKSMDANGTYALEDTIVPENPVRGAQFGSKLAINMARDLIVVTAPDDTFGGAEGAGALFIYEKLSSTSSWILQERLGGVGQAAARLGEALSMNSDGSVIAAGSAKYDAASPTLRDSGAVYVWSRGSQGNWTQRLPGILDDSPSPSEELGAAVQLSANGRQILYSAPRAGAGIVYYRCTFNSSCDLLYCPPAPGGECLLPTLPPTASPTLAPSLPTPVTLMSLSVSDSQSTGSSAPLTVSSFISPSESLGATMAASSFAASSAALSSMTIATAPVSDQSVLIAVLATSLVFLSLIFAGALVFLKKSRRSRGRSLTTSLHSSPSRAGRRSATSRRSRSSTAGEHQMVPMRRSRSSSKSDHRKSVSAAAPPQAAVYQLAPSHQALQEKKYNALGTQDTEYRSLQMVAPHYQNVSAPATQQHYVSGAYASSATGSQENIYGELQIDNQAYDQVPNQQVNYDEVPTVSPEPTDSEYRELQLK